MRKEELVDAIVDALQKNEKKIRDKEMEKATGWHILEIGIAIAFSGLYAYFFFGKIPVYNAECENYFPNIWEAIMVAFSRVTNEGFGSIPWAEYWDTIVMVIGFLIILVFWLYVRISSARQHTREQSYKHVSVMLMIGALAFAVLQYYDAVHPI